MADALKLGGVDIEELRRLGLSAEDLEFVRAQSAKYLGRFQIEASHSPE